MSDKLSSNLGTTEIQTVQSRMYPFDAWESENASRYSQPKIKVLEPYKLYASYRPTVHSVSSDNYTITDIDGYDLILVTTGADDRTITLPTVADNTDRIIKVMKADSGAGKVILDGEGAETINGDTVRHLVSQYNYVEVVSDGSEWFVLSHFQSYSTGWENTNDWTNVHLGTGGIGNNVAHNLNTHLVKLTVRLVISSDGTDANSLTIPQMAMDYPVAQTSCNGTTIYEVDDDNLIVQTGSEGINYVNKDAAGIVGTINNNDWYYNIIVERTE